MRVCVLVFICVFANIMGMTSGKECIWGVFGDCMERCPPDTYSYTPGCVMTLSRRTCRAPVARPLGKRCDYSRCDCAPPKVWDEAARKCVLMHQCSDQSGVMQDQLQDEVSE